VDGVIREYNATFRRLLQYACPKQNMNIAVDRCRSAACCMIDFCACLPAAEIPGRKRRESVYGIVRHAFPIMAVLCLESVSAAPSVTDPSRDTGYNAANGRAAYTTNCLACHGANGEGRPGADPPLKGSGVVTKDDPTKHILVVLNGLQGAKAGGVLYTSSMPPFGSILSDVDIADIIDYERSSWGNHGKLVTAAQVAAQRGHPSKTRMSRSKAATKSRHAAQFRAIHHNC
jgi:mono/diheme cytochrome c family protein